MGERERDRERKCSNQLSLSHNSQGNPKVLERHHNPVPSLRL